MRWMKKNGRDSFLQQSSWWPLRIFKEAKCSRRVSSLRKIAPTANKPGQIVSARHCWKACRLYKKLLVCV